LNTGSTSLEKETVGVVRSAHETYGVQLPPPAAASPQPGPESPPELFPSEAGAELQATMHEHAMAAVTKKDVLIGWAE